MHVSVDRERCISSGNCVLTADAVFDQDDEGVSIVLDASPPATLHVPVRAAVARCPVGAISIDDDR